MLRQVAAQCNYRCHTGIASTTPLGYIGQEYKDQHVFYNIQIKPFKRRSISFWWTFNFIHWSDGLVYVIRSWVLISGFWELSNSNIWYLSCNIYFLIVNVVITRWVLLSELSNTLILDIYWMRCSFSHLKSWCDNKLGFNI